MAKERSIEKYDPNTEIFQMRAQWKKMDNCRKQWFEQWSWLLEEKQATIDEANKVRSKFPSALPKKFDAKVTTKTLKPVPMTTTGQIGWLSSRPDCQLEIYTSWLQTVPVRLPDVWQDPDYTGQVQQQ